MGDAFDPLVAAAMSKVLRRKPAAPQTVHAQPQPLTPQEREQLAAQRDALTSRHPEVYGQEHADLAAARNAWRARHPMPERLTPEAIPDVAVTSGEPQFLPRQPSAVQVTPGQPVVLGMGDADYGLPPT